MPSAISLYCLPDQWSWFKDLNYLTDDPNISADFMQYKGICTGQDRARNINHLMTWYLFGNRIFNVQTITEIKKYKIKNLAVKKGFPQFLLSMYVCLCVCLSVIALQTSSFNIGV